MEQKTISFTDPNLFIRQIVGLWVKHWASDIHITPSKTKVYIRFRIWGELISFYNIDSELFERFSNAVKINSGMDINIHDNVQDWKMFLNLEIAGAATAVNIRVSCLPTVHGENIVLRILLSKSEYLDVEKLWFSEKNLATLKEIPKIKEGLVLCCWGTWSWKTTTLYSILSSYDPKKTGIFTLEDPVEYQIEWYVQSEIRNDRTDKATDSSYTFEEWLTWILRQDPDVLLIWEIRRAEEATICLEAANTGHIVYWSIHSNNSISVISRLKQLWMEPFLLATWIKYIISQKLVRKICPVCREKQQINKTNMSEGFHKFILNDTIEVYKAKEWGCDKCLNGFKWSTLVSEIIHNDEDFYKMIVSDHSELEMKHKLIETWFIPYYIHALQKSISWEIDIKDVFNLEY